MRRAAVMRRAVIRRAALALAAIMLAAAGPPPAARPISRMNTQWWRARHEAKLAEIRHERVDLVFLGDSITQDWEKSGPPPWQDFRPVWQRFYGARHAVNLGFKGDATSHLLWRIEHGEIDGIAPRAAVILIGANNLGRLHWSAQDTVEGIDAVVAEARRRLPHTGIILLGVLPSIRNAWVDRSTAEINAALAAHYGGGKVQGVTYLDVTPIFMKDGKVDPADFLDPHLTPPEPPLHPTPAAQAGIAEAVEPALKRLLAAPPLATTP
ncbi:MAG TPA: GDSL-type esterase/lipase family protein [Acetobacteraceae bacterium]|nr:GDSL-type esterase/lipase family protein [Acetobacteraceae bacterium]